ncbi:hypothetical protein bas34_0159 [Escherichia phage SelmaRatti]|uniref:Uncharacterized protein n=1 Tax=Escherichia phage SelmaRatti TaxID=2852006 RepID=A0AAE7VYP0_9CAUD|nr:hypothetical protein bas34_0159 [Escherichia phage SelmaRatti]
MKINLPSSEFSPKSLLLDDIINQYSYINGEVYRACSDFLDYPDYPIYKGDFIIPVYNGVLVVCKAGAIVIDSCTLSQETFKVPIELTNYSTSITVQ